MLESADHHALGAINNGACEIVVRRFLSMEKARRLVDQGLHFSPASWFSDPAEGHYPGPRFARRQDAVRAHGLDERQERSAHDDFNPIAGHNKNVVLISCWTTGDTREHRFWSEYASLSSGVAIESTVGRLSVALGDQFLIVPVRYIDYRTESIHLDHSLRPFLQKSVNYAWEKEIRVIAEMEPGTKLEPKGRARNVSINLGNVITRAVLAPRASQETIRGAEYLFTPLSIPILRSS